MRENQNLEKLVKLKPDYIGFIFYINSPRFAGENTPILPHGIKKTGVFVNSQIEFIKKMIKNIAYNLYSFTEMKNLNSVNY